LSDLRVRLSFLRSTDSRTTEWHPAHLRVVAGKKHIRSRYMSPSHIGQRAIHPLTAARRDHDSRGADGTSHPVAHEVSTALLHPSIKVARCNLVGKIQKGVLRLKNFDRSFLDAYASIAVSHGIRSVMAGIECVRTGIVLQDQRSPTRDEIEQLPILDSHIGADVVGADTHHDGVK